MKNDTLILAGVMAVGVGYLGMKNKEALGEMAGKLSVGSSGGGVDLSWMGDVFGAVAGAGNKVVEVVKDGAGDLGGFDLRQFGEDVKNYVDDKVEGAGNFVKDIDVIPDVDLGLDGAKAEAKSFWEKLKNNPVAKVWNGTNTVIDTVSESFAGVFTLLPQMAMSGLGAYGKDAPRATWEKIKANNPNSIHRTNYTPKSSSNSGGNNFMKIINPDPNSNPLMSSLSNVTQGAGSVGNNRRNDSLVAQMKNAGIEAIKKNPNSPFNPDGTWK